MICSACLFAIAMVYPGCNNRSSATAPAGNIPTEQYTCNFDTINNNFKPQTNDTTGTVKDSGRNLLIGSGILQPVLYWALQYNYPVTAPRFVVSMRCSTTADTKAYEFSVAGKVAEYAGTQLQEGYYATVSPVSDKVALQRIDTINTGLDSAGEYSIMQTLASKSTRLNMGANKWYSLSLEINGTLLTTIVKDMTANVSDTLSYTDTINGVKGTYVNMNGELPTGSSLYIDSFQVTGYH
jgi:hypothetical protein